MLFYESSSFWISKMTAKQHCSSFGPDSVYQNNLFGSHNTRHFIIIIISPPGLIIDVTGPCSWYSDSQAQVVSPVRITLSPTLESSARD